MTDQPDLPGGTGQPPPFAMAATCRECPWLLGTPPGQFRPGRYRMLEATCRPGGLPPVFACHMTDGKPRACAGFLLVCGHDNNRIRMAASMGTFDPGKITAVGPLYASFDDLARANGYDPPPRRDKGKSLRRRAEPAGAQGEDG